MAKQSLPQSSHQSARAPAFRVLFASAAVLALVACDSDGNLQRQNFDLDLRSLAGGFNTTEAARNLPDRPRPDNRGVISYPNYQVVVAERDETARMIAGRLGLDAEELARFNGIEADVPLRRDEILALPSRVSEPSAATGAIGSGPIQPPTVNVTTLASDAIDRAGEQTVAPASSTPATSPQTQTGSEPIRHRVTRGETAFQIARLYDVPVASLSQWNGLGSDLTVREGQQLLIPVAGATPPSTFGSDTTSPGTGSVTPTPPSASAPLPDNTSTTPPATAAAAPPAPDIGQPSAPAASRAPFVYPVNGNIIREYASGRNDGIDIAAAAGTPVKAAAAGTIAAITQNTNGAKIIVVRHTGNILTVYVNVEDLSVVKDDSVSQGQTIAKVAEGSPSFLHFEVRDGLESVDPADYLP